MAVTFKNFKNWLLSAVGDQENSDRDVREYMDTLADRIVEHTWPRRVLVQNETTGYVGQTVSLSASQPMLAVPIFTADKACKVKAAFFQQFVSATVAATATGAFHVLVTRKGSGTTFASRNGSATLTGTYSVTSYIAGVSSDSTKHGTASHSFSALTQNVADAPNRMLLNPAANALYLAPGDVLLAQVLKGSGSANDTGGIFRGGKLTVRLTYGDAT